MASSLSAEQAHQLIGIVTDLCAHTQRDYLDRHGIEWRDAAQEIYRIILEEADRYDPARAAWSTWVSVLARRRLISLCRKYSAACRRLAPELKAAAWEAENVPAEEEGERAEVISGYSALQLATCLMTAARGLPADPRERRKSRYSPATRAVVVALAAKLKLTGGEMRGLVRSDPRLARVLKLIPLPDRQIFVRWCKSNVYLDIAGSIKGGAIPL